MSFLAKVMEGFMEGLAFSRQYECQERLNACVQELVNEGKLTYQEASALQESISSTLYLTDSTSTLNYGGVTHTVKTTVYVE